MKNTKQAPECAICGQPEFNPLHGARVHGLSCPKITGGDAGDCTCEPSPQHAFHAPEENTDPVETIPDEDPTKPEEVRVRFMYEDGDPEPDAGWYASVEVATGSEEGEHVGSGYAPGDDDDARAEAILEAVNDALTYAATSGHRFKFTELPA